MKKYLMIGFAAIAFASCSNHDFETYSPEQIVKAEYDAKFIAEFGQPGANQDWGFGTASTRAVKSVYSSDNYSSYGLTKPTDFTDETPTAKKPSMDGISFTYASTLKGADNTISSIDDNDTFVITEAYMAANGEWAPYGLDAKKNLTIYIDGDVTCHGATYQEPGQGPTFIVTEGSTLRFKGVRNYVKIYLASGATLDLRNLDEVTFENYGGIYMSANSTVYAKKLTMKVNGEILNAGGLLDVDDLQLENGTVLWNEGNVDIENALRFDNNNSLVYNANVEGKTFTVGSLTMATAGNTVYNDGTFTCEHAMVLSAGASEFVNAIDGSFTAASVSLSAAAKMYNAGTATIYGLTKIDNNTTMWLNEGQYTSGDFEITGFDKTGSNVWNNCKLTVTATGVGMTGSGNFHLNRGAIILEGGAESGSALVADSFTIEDTSGFYMGSKSMVNVDGTMYTDIYNSGYGFFGVGNSKAVIKAARMVKSGDKQFSMSYHGNLHVDIPDHFDQGYIDTPNTNQPFYAYDETVSFGPESSSPVRINPSACNPGYGPTDTNNYDGRIMAEDLSVNESSDWDFNDVVIDYKINADGTASILLQAAGGTLPLTIGGSLSGDEVVLDESGNPKDAVEVHRDLFKVSTSTMVNTGVGQTKPAVPYTLRDKAYSSPADIVLCVQKSVNGEKKWVVIPARKGDPAGKFVAEKDTPWCDEYANIKFAWGNFTNYVQTGSGKFNGESKNELYFDRALKNERVANE